jgi:hypothetical protein
MRTAFSGLAYAALLVLLVVAATVCGATRYANPRSTSQSRPRSISEFFRHSTGGNRSGERHKGIVGG